MEIIGETKILRVEGTELTLLDDADQDSYEREINTIELTGLESAEPNYLKYGYGYLRLVHNDSPDLPEKLDEKYESARNEPLSLTFSKKLWKAAEPKIMQLQRRFESGEKFTLVDKTTNTVITPKVQRTKIDASWQEHKETILEALTNTPITGYFILNIDQLNFYLQGTWELPNRLYLETALPDDVSKETLKRLKETGWTPPTDPDIPNYSIAVSWSEEEATHVADFLTNTLYWSFDLDPEAVSFTVSIEAES
ncbi:MAG: hypothetical protein RIQ88_391 [Actinomycetota bacterium]